MRAVIGHKPMFYQIMKHRKGVFYHFSLIASSQHLVRDDEVQFL